MTYQAFKEVEKKRSSQMSSTECIQCKYLDTSYSEKFCKHQKSHEPMFQACSITDIISSYLRRELAIGENLIWKVCRHWERCLLTSCCTLMNIYNISIINLLWGLLIPFLLIQYLTYQSTSNSNALFNLKKNWSISFPLLCSNILCLWNLNIWNKVERDWKLGT
jgi:hypothetical protein